VRRPRNEPATVATVSVDMLSADSAALPTETGPASAGERGGQGVGGAPIDLEAWPARAFLALADVLGRYHRHQGVHHERRIGQKCLVPE